MAKKRLGDLKIDELLAWRNACQVLLDECNTSMVIEYSSNEDIPYDLIGTKGKLQQHIGDIDNIIENKLEDEIDW